MLNDFKAFLLKTNALALAVGVIIGAASGKVVSALVADIIMPPIGQILPKGDWRDAQYELSRSVVSGKLTINAIKYGDFIGSVVDFIAIALVVFFITKWLLKREPEVPVQTCPYCKDSNALDATRCKSCTSELKPA